MLYSGWARVEHWMPDSPASDSQGCRVPWNNKRRGMPKAGLPYLRRLKRLFRTSQFIAMVTTLGLFFFNLNRTSIKTCAVMYSPRSTNQTAKTAPGTRAKKNPKLMLMRARKRARRPRFLWNTSQMKRPFVLISLAFGAWGRLRNENRWYFYYYIKGNFVAA